MVKDIDVDEMRAACEVAVVGRGGRLVNDVDLCKPSSCVPSKLLDGGAESGTCGICSIFVQTRGLLDCCNHLFCFSCITEWFTVSNLCPLCKSRSRFITPQMLFSDTGRWEKVESVSGTGTRDEEPNDEDSQPVSFPPYFIDEEAVLCLEGDSCLVRAGLLDLDAEGNTASDTSVACDLCDCWYHGGCVNFHPDQTAFICPRCLTSKEMDRASMDAPNLSTVSSSEKKVTSTMPSSPLKNQSTYEGPTTFGSASVAVEDPEEGESHVSFSLRRILHMPLPVEAQPSMEDSEKELMWSPIREPFVVPTYGIAWPPFHEPSKGRKSVNGGVLPSTREPVRKVPYFEEELWSPTREPAVKVPELQENLWSPKRQIGRDMLSVETRPKFTAASPNNVRAKNSLRLESRGILNPGGPQTVVPYRPEILSRSARIESFSTVGQNLVTANEVSRGFVHLNTTESVIDPTGLIKEEISIDVDRLQVAVEQLRKGKRKVLHEDERNVNVKDLPEMPRKIARKSARKIDGLEDRDLVVGTDLVKKATTDQVVGKQIDDKAVNSLESMTKVETLDDTSLSASKKKIMAAEVPANKEEKRVVVDATASKEEKRMAADVLAGKEDTRMAVDAPANKEGKRMAADVFTGKEEKRMTADVVAIKEENRIEADVVASREEKRIEADAVASKEEKSMEADVVAGGHNNTLRPKSLNVSAIKTESSEVSNKEHYASPQSDDLSAPEKVEVSSLDMSSEVDVMDIVKDGRECVVKDGKDGPVPSTGVRTRIIMHREPDMKDSARLSLVDRIRQQMRDTVGYGAGDDLGKVEVSDDRFIAAFKAAQTRSYEKSKDRKSGSSRPQISGRLGKVLDKKYTAKGARDSLTRKLYAGGGRKCWDRDWDIAFWRERDPHHRRSRNEGEAEVDGSRKDDSGGTDSEDAEFFSRLYIADTSLFPRNEDVKPLSVQANHAEGTCLVEPESNKTVPKPRLDRVNPTPGMKDKAQQSPVVQGASGTTSGADRLSRGSKNVDPLLLKAVQMSLKPPSLSIESSSKANASAIAGQTEGFPSAALKAQVKSTGATSASSDVKKDKRQWALEVLARKEGKLSIPSSSGKTGGGGSATKDNPFPLLLQLPVEMRPLISGDSRRQQIPPAVRQVQLNRLVEQELKRANLAVIEKSSKCDDAIAKAVAREEDLCRSSKTKGVYLNRCARALTNTEYEIKVVETSPPEDHEDSGARLEESTRPEYGEAVRRALEDTGLMDSPIADPVNEHDGHISEDTRDTKCKVSDTNGASRPTRLVENKWVENVLEVENADLDIYGDFEFSLDDELCGALPKENSQKLKQISAASSNCSDGKARTGPLMVVLTTGGCQSEATLESGDAGGPTKQSAEGKGGASCCNGGGLGSSSSTAVEAEACELPVETSSDVPDDMYDGLELNLNPVLSSEVMAQLSAEPCASLYSKLPVLDVDLKKEENESLSKGDAAASENPSEDDGMKFADIDRRIENIRKSKSGDPHRVKKSKSRHGDTSRTNETNVQTQVEIYVNQHLKPLYRSQVITAEQFKWTVSKTAAKVMEYHANAVNADFLIDDGNKIKSLANQYLKAFAHRRA